MKILTGHTSFETAYVVNDYPYGFRLRCRIAYWLEFKPKHGYRLVSRTTNPKRAGEVWNKPKASTYCPFAVMYLNELEHVTWAGLHVAYGTADEAKAWADKWGDGLVPDERRRLDVIIKAKAAYEAKRKEAAGDNPTHTLPLDVGLKEAHEAIADDLIAEVVDMEDAKTMHDTIKKAVGE